MHEDSLGFPSAAEEAQRGYHNLLAEYSLLINIINGDVCQIRRAGQNTTVPLVVPCQNLLLYELTFFCIFPSLFKRMASSRRKKPKHLKALPNNTWIKSDLKRKIQVLPS